MTDPVELRAKYLQEAAHLLAVPSLSACAVFGIARDRLLEDSKVEVPPKDWDAIRRETCGACGVLMIPGWSCQISNRTEPRKERRKGKKDPNDPETPKTSMMYCCLRCNRKTEQMLQSQARRNTKKAKSATTTLEIRSSKKDDDAKPKTANASSKQRQKARKGGLQAMLEKNKSQTANLGLDLMDFAM